jgi:hypothetical protein
MEVTIKYTDEHSLTVEEVVAQATHNYGKNVTVEIMPDSTKAYDLIYFGLQQIVTHRQLSMLFDDKIGYQPKLKSLRSEVLFKVQEILDQVLVDNESKVT